MRNLPTLLKSFFPGSKKSSTRSHSNGFRKLHFENFEECCLLTTFNVNVDYDTDQIDNDNTIVTLREAVFRANEFADPDTIHFDPNIFNTPQTINLTQGELEITEAVTIDAEGKDITIDANQGSRVS